MTKYKEPKDFMLGRRAYEAFYNEEPQIWFEDLAHHAQMKWVTVARAVSEEVKRLEPDSKKPEPSIEGLTPQEEEEELERFLASAPRRGSLIDWKALDPAKAKSMKQLHSRIYNRKYRAR